MATTYKKGELQDHEGKQLLPRTKAALVETEDGSNVEEKLGAFLPFSGGTMTGPAVGAPGAIATPQFRNVQYGTEPLTPGESPLPQGTLYITPEASPVAGGFSKVWSGSQIDIYCSGNVVAIVTNKPLSLTELYVSSNPSVPFGFYGIAKTTISDTIPGRFLPVGSITGYPLRTTMSSTGLDIKSSDIDAFKGSIIINRVVFCNGSIAPMSSFYRGTVLGMYMI